MEDIEDIEEIEEIEDKEDKELNDEWINNFEKTDKLYEDYYKDDLYYVNLKFIYLNRENEIEMEAYDIRGYTEDYLDGQFEGDDVDYEDYHDT